MNKIILSVLISETTYLAVTASVSICFWAYGALVSSKPLLFKIQNFEAFLQKLFVYCLLSAMRPNLSVFLFLATDPLFYGSYDICLKNTCGYIVSLYHLIIGNKPGDVAFP